jgi:mannose-6-phosphate isomerase-like protein (cupin superfamily)
MSWSDLGSWEALWEISTKDGADNAVFGDVIATGSSGSLVRSEGASTIVALGVQDLVVVATGDAVLVTPRARAQDVGLFVDALRHDERHNHLLQNTAQNAPTYGQNASCDTIQTRHVNLLPGEKLSLEHSRPSHWIVLSGTGRITHEDTVNLLRENDSAFLPAGVERQIENAGAIPLRLFEVQVGSSI